MKNLSPLLFLCLLFSIHLQGQSDASKARYDAILEANFKKDGPGVAALVAKDGKVIYQGAIGKAHVELDLPMTTDYVFRIGSITKQFTAVGILMLQEQGKLNVQDAINKYLPDYPTQGKTISIEHLLTHTSGIKSYTNISEFNDFLDKTMSQEEMIATFKDKPMEFDPGTAYAYNNSGYFLLGVIIEKISGLSYEAFIQKNIFDQADMTNSYYGAHAPIIKNRAPGYSEVDGELVNAPYISMDWPYSAGALLSTVGDLLKWNNALHSGMFIKPATLETAFVDYKLKDGSSTNYGYGWEVTKILGSPTYEHGGGVHGFLTYGIYLPEEKIFVAAFSNCNCQAPSFAAKVLAAEALGKRPKEEAGITLDEAMMKQYIGSYEISKGDERQIMLEDGQLMSQRRGAQMLMKPYAKDKFMLENSLVTFEFIRDDKGKVIEMVAHQQTGAKDVAKRVSEQPKVKKVVEISEDLLRKYVGLYELAPNFALDITLEEGQLYLQATGQQRFPIFAESEEKFFLKVVDARVEFFNNEEGDYNKLVLYQNGMELPGIKK